MSKPKKNTPEKPKILWLTSSYPRFPSDSASIFLQYLATAISQKDHDIHILSPDHHNIKKNLQEPFLTKHHFQYAFPRHCQNLAYGSGILPNLKKNKWLYLQIPFFIFAFFVSAFRIIRQIKPSLIHAHWVFPQGLIAVILGKIFNIPVITTAHGGDAFALNNTLLGKLKSWTINNCSAWTSNTNATANALGNKIKPPVIIPMGIDYKKFSTGNSKQLRSTIPQDTLILLFVGRLVEKKGVNDLLTAYSLLSSFHKEKTQLWIIGDGAERNTLEDLSASLNLENHVTFWGKLPNEQLYDFYAAADIFIAPSITDSSGDTEGQGVMLLEAMASGTAIISTDTGGISEVINHGKTGLLTSPKQPAKLKSTIAQLIDSPKLRETIANNGKKAALAYNWTNIGHQFITLYQHEIQKS